MASVYHYNGMSLHYLDEDGNYAVYYKPPKQGERFVNHCNPYRVYKLTLKYSIYSGNYTSHKLVDKYADLRSAINRIYQMQGRGEL